MTHTIETLKAWLADDSQFHHKTQKAYFYNGFDFLGIRKRFRLNNGKKISIQQSPLHYCTTDSVEMHYCHHSLLIAPYGIKEGGHSPYARVPLQVVVDYLNEQENL